MTDLKEYLNSIQSSRKNVHDRSLKEILQFFVDNDWFDNRPSMENGSVFLTDDMIRSYAPHVDAYLSAEDDIQTLSSRLKNRFPQTASKFLTFCEKNRIDEDASYYVLQFLLCRLKKELSLYTDTDMEALVKLASEDLTKAHGECFTFFVAWLKKHCRTAYYKEYIMQKRYTMDIQNEAYSMDEYLELCYYLFNSSYIEENHMYERAVESSGYTAAWLYLSIHFICSIRYTDLARIYHPDLPYEPEKVLQKVKEGTFSYKDSQYVLLSLTTRMCCLPFTPNKTKAYSGISDVKFHIPASCEEHFGRLFALAEAHARLEGNESQPLIRKVSTYREIKNSMGDEIGDLFLESDFRSRSATKSYLQMIYLMSDEILTEEDELDIKGSVLASLARSHKGTYGEFSSTTYEYLKDAKLSGLSPEFIAFELLERGVLSFIPSMLLKVITDGKYDRLPVKQQTELVKTLDLSPYEVESIFSVVETGREQAETAVQEVVQSGADIRDVLQRIASGRAFSKENECMCLMSALKKLCPYEQRRQCVGCRYEIGTKSTLYLLISECNRMKHLYATADTPLEKQKYKKLLTTVVIPKMDEMLQCLKTDYGEEVFRNYEQLIRENT